MKCFWLFGHDWSKWETDKVKSDSYGNVKLYQHRECRCCGKIVLRGSQA